MRVFKRKKNPAKKLLSTVLTATMAGTLLLAGCGTPSKHFAQAFSPNQNQFYSQRRFKSFNSRTSRNNRFRRASNSQRDWQDEIIYFIFTDRFANGNRNNDFNVKKNDPWAYHGGDLDGIINKLDYIKDLGATAIWLTPVVDNRDEVFNADFGGGKMQGIWGYHGYWTKDFYKVDEHLGNMAKFKELIAKAHDKGIKILLDIVVNHTDYDHPFAKDRKNPKSKYHKWFNQHGPIKDYSDQWWVENGELAELPDFNQSHPEAMEYLIEQTKFWVKTGVDGFRIDTVKHVPRHFWRKFSHEIHRFAGPDFMLLGEVYDGRPEFCNNYIQDGLDSVFDFPLYYTIKDVFGQQKSMRRLGALFAKDKIYANPNLLSPFIDNHDVPRFVHEASGDKRQQLKLSMALLMTIRGMPMVYYGTEVGLPGGGDPDNRRDMDWNKDPNLRNYLKNLISLRKKHPALRRGKQLEMWQDDVVYGYTRLTPNKYEEVMTFINNSHQTQERRVPIRAESPLKSTQHTLVNLLNPKETTQVKDGFITIKIPAKSASIFTVRR